MAVEAKWCLVPLLQRPPNCLEDVVTLYRKIIHHEAEIVSLLPAVDNQQEPETTQFLEAVTEIFGLTRYDENSGKG